jgi:hypothetical protein
VLNYARLQINLESKITASVFGTSAPDESSEIQECKSERRLGVTQIRDGCNWEDNSCSRRKTVVMQLNFDSRAAMFRSLGQSRARERPLDRTMGREVKHVSLPPGSVEGKSSGNG